MDLAYILLYYKYVKVCQYTELEKLIEKTMIKLYFFVKNYHGRRHVFPTKTQLNNDQTHLNFPEAGANNSNSRTSTPNSLRNNMPVKIKSEVDVSERNGTSAGIDEKPVKMAAVAKIEDRGRKRRASDESVDVSVVLC